MTGRHPTPPTSVAMLGERQQEHHTPRLHEAALVNDTVTITSLLAARPCTTDVNALDASRCTALHLAVSAGHSKSVKLLLSLGADPTRHDLNGMTALHYAIEAGSMPSLMQLIKHMTVWGNLERLNSADALPNQTRMLAAGKGEGGSKPVKVTGPSSSLMSTTTCREAKLAAEARRRSSVKGSRRGVDVTHGSPRRFKQQKQKQKEKQQQTGKPSEIRGGSAGAAAATATATSNAATPPRQVIVCGINVQRTCNGVYTHLAPGKDFEAANLVSGDADGRAIYKHSTEDLFMRYISDRKCWMISALKHVNSADSEQRARGYVYSRDDALHPTDVLDWEVHGFDGWALSTLVTVTDVEQVPPSFMEVNGLRDRVARFNGYYVLQPERHNGRALYKHSTKDMFLRFIDRSKTWMITDRKSTLANDNLGYVCGKDYDILYPSLGTTWKVPDTNTSLGWMLLESVKVRGFEEYAQVAPRKIRLDGLSKPCDMCNGYYVLQPEMHNGHCLYKLASDTRDLYLRYVDWCGTWMVSPAANMESNDALGYVQSGQRDLLYPDEAVAWMVVQGLEFVVEASVRLKAFDDYAEHVPVALELSHMKFSGAYSNLLRCAGTYYLEPELHNHHVLYKHTSSEFYLRYVEGSGYMLGIGDQVADNDHKGYMCSTARYPISPPTDTGGGEARWNVYDPAVNVWQPQSDIRVRASFAHDIKRRCYAGAARAGSAFGVGTRATVAGVGVHTATNGNGGGLSTAVAHVHTPRASEAVIRRDGRHDDPKPPCVTLESLLLDSSAAGGGEMQRAGGIGRQQSHREALLNARNSALDTPLHLAALAQNPKVAQALIGAGADTRATNANMDTALHLAARTKNAKMAQVLLCSRKNWPSRQAQVVSQQQQKKKKKEEEAQRRRRRRQPQQQCLCKRVASTAVAGTSTDTESNADSDVDTCWVECANTGSIDVRNAAGCSALHVAAGCGAAAVVCILHHAKADVDLRDNRGRTPLMHAVLGGAKCAQVVAMLCTMGADLLCEDDNNLNVLQMAASKEVEAELVQFLCVTLEEMITQPDLAAWQKKFGGSQRGGRRNKKRSKQQRESTGGGSTAQPANWVLAQALCKTDKPFRNVGAAYDKELIAVGGSAMTQAMVESKVVRFLSKAPKVVDRMATSTGKAGRPGTSDNDIFAVAACAGNFQALRVLLAVVKGYHTVRLSRQTLAHADLRDMFAFRSVVGSSMTSRKKETSRVASVRHHNTGVMRLVDHIIQNLASSPGSQDVLEGFLATLVASSPHVSSFATMCCASVCGTCDEHGLAYPIKCKGPDGEAALRVAGYFEETMPRCGICDERFAAFWTEPVAASGASPSCPSSTDVAATADTDTTADAALATADVGLVADAAHADPAATTGAKLPFDAAITMSATPDAAKNESVPGSMGAIAKGAGAATMGSATDPGDDNVATANTSVRAAVSVGQAAAEPPAIAARVSEKVRHEHFEKPACLHMFCKSCLSQWINSRLGDRSCSIRCPEEACKGTLYVDDVARLAGDNAAQKFVELRSTDYRDRLEELLIEPEGSRSQHIAEDSIPCPRCYVILHKHSGCDQMMCPCGHQFSWNSASWPTLSDLVLAPRLQEANTSYIADSARQNAAPGMVLPINDEDDDDDGDSDPDYDTETEYDSASWSDDNNQRDGRISPGLDTDSFPRSPAGRPEMSVY